MLSDMKKTLIFICLALAACVGHPADDLDDEQIIGPGAQTEEGAPALLLDFTATWCVNCPRMASAVEEAARLRPGSVFPVSIHFRDDMATPEGEAAATTFGVQAYPSLIVNLSKSSLITATSTELILAKMDATAAQRKGTCTLELSLEGGKLIAEAGVSEAGSYSLGVLLLEDGVTAPQTGADDNYVHDNILRKILSGSIAGEDLGALEPGVKVRKEYSVETEGTGKYHVVAYITDGSLVQTVSSINVI